jgi:hypothetical protein
MHNLKIIVFNIDLYSIILRLYIEIFTPFACDIIFRKLLFLMSMSCLFCLEYVDIDAFKLFGGLTYKISRWRSISGIFF